MTITDIAEGKCPRCREGRMFVHPPYNYLRFYQMRENCPVCDQTFHPEPGFYFGAMYVSYAFSVAWVLGICLILLLLGKFELITAGVIITVGIVFLLPFMFQYSRILFLYGFGGIRRRSK